MKSKQHSTPLLQILTLFFLLAAYQTCEASDSLNLNNSLTDNQTLTSSDGTFALGFFSPHNSNNRYIGIWYNKITVQTVVWVANRDKPITNNSLTASFFITSNSTISILAANKVIWSLNATKSLLNPVLQLLDNGNLVLKESGEDNFAWQSFYHPTDTLLPGMRYGVNFKTGMNTTLTAWQSESDPSTGNYHGYMDISGDPELVLLSSNNQKIWRTGPWNGQSLSGVPDTLSYNGINLTFTINSDEISYSFYVPDQSSILTRLVVNSSGLMQRWLWMKDDQAWNMFWYAPKDQCDSYAPCGPFGVCDPNNSPICDCLHGFTPKIPSAWALRDGSQGCVRKTSLDCGNRTDGFVTVSETKLPDTSNATVDTTIGLDECKQRCLKNCSCTGYAAANILGSGSGCVIWTSELTDIRVYTSGGQDLYLRLAAADLDSSGGEPHKRNVTIAITVSLVLVVLLALGGFYLWRKRKNRLDNVVLGTNSFNDNMNTKHSHENDMELPLFEFDIILVATDSFSMANKIGEGGFGPVYKGKLDDGQEIAVKRLARHSSQGIDEFKNEVMLIVKLQHRNLVRLLGCCIHGEERILVYEYMQNKSLDAFLFDKTKGTILDWQSRYSIIQGIARGLLYLHHDSRLRIIHRDLKASNILLDNKMNPKISDFGMARIFGGDESEVNTRRVVGTYGYMAPEYAMDGIFSVKSDVFSFGVLVLEIVTGKKNKGVYMSSSHINLLGHAWNSWKDGNIIQIVDDSIRDDCSLDEVLKCMHIGLLCVQERPEDRPLMTSVVLMLGSDGSSLKKPKQPEFITRGTTLEAESSSSKNDSANYNEMTVSMLQGR